MAMNSVADFETLSFSSIPQEIVEHVAFYAATENFLGPPAGILPLLLLDRRTHTILSLASNYPLYARIFEYKFDPSPAIYHRWPDLTPVNALAAELQLRCKHLTRVRQRLDATVVQSPVDSYDEDAMKTSLLIGYLMMTENGDKNRRQLTEWAQMNEWLEEYWFGLQGASLTALSIKENGWPPNTEANALAMWLFWFLLEPESSLKRTQEYRNMTSILKLMALGAHHYNLCSSSWIEFRPEAKHSRPTASSFVYPLGPNLSIPPLAPAAILSYLTIVNTLKRMNTIVDDDPDTFTGSGIFDISRESYDWSGEWERCLSIGRSSYDMSLTLGYTPGALQGVWEGVFTYTEFTAYAALLSGAPPPVLHNSLLAQHRQTWKLREYHLLPPKESGAGLNAGGEEPLSAGNPLRAYLPDEVMIHERPNGVDIQEPGRNQSLFYHKATGLQPTAQNSAGDDRDGSIVQDVIILGEGHSAWGQFNLIGRVRPCDGFISLSKEYTDGDRGRWLYRGYLVGNTNGNLSGRWRDTMSPANVPGYEGCFVMSRRR